MVHKCSPRGIPDSSFNTSIPTSSEPNQHTITSHISTTLEEKAVLVSIRHNNTPDVESQADLHTDLHDAHQHVGQVETGVKGVCQGCARVFDFKQYYSLENTLRECLVCKDYIMCNACFYRKFHNHHELQAVTFGDYRQKMYE